MLFPIATQLYWEEKSEGKEQKAGPENRTKSPPIYIYKINVKNISQLIQLLE
jgi:hypothetical protein